MPRTGQRMKIPHAITHSDHLRLCARQISSKESHACDEFAGSAPFAAQITTHHALHIFHLDKYLLRAYLTAATPPPA
jgi:hypothetical protein